MRLNRLPTARIRVKATLVVAGVGEEVRKVFMTVAS
jgi:hypothetical protein